MTQPLAQLPWYDLEEVRWANDALWSRLAAALHEEGRADVPGALDRTRGYAVSWQSDAFLFGQACGYDVLRPARDRLRVVATPHYGAPGCEGPRYASHLVVRAHEAMSDLEHLRGGTCVVNTGTSHSGMNVLRATIAPRARGGRFFRDVRHSGSHEQSLRMLQAGEADVAAVDCVTWRLLERHRPAALRRLRILETLPRVTAPPFVTSRATPPDLLEALRRALFAALEDPALQPARDALELHGASVLPLEAYAEISDMELAAETLDYHEIRPWVPVCVE